MFIFPIPSQIYPFLSLLIAVAAPWLFLRLDSDWKFWTVEAVDVILLGFVWWATTNRDFNFWTSLLLIARRNQSGCFNLTVIYMVPLLLVMYVIGIVLSVIGIKAGKAWVERTWVRIVCKLARLAPPRWAAGETVAPSQPWS